MLLALIVVILLGLAAGVLVNVLADDLPLRRRVRTPRYVPDAKKRAIHVMPIDTVQGEVSATAIPGEDLPPTVIPTEPAPQPDSRPDDDDPFYAGIPGRTYDELVAFTRSDDEKRPLGAWSGLAAFLTGQRVSPEGVKLSWRYPLAEILTVFLMAITLLATWDDPDIPLLQLAFYLAYMLIFALITVIDVEHKLILFVVIIPSMALALFDAAITPAQNTPTLQNALYGGALGFGVFFLMYGGGFVFTYVMGMARGQRITEVAFGYGDVMMATLAGLILGWRALIFAMFITVFLGAFGAFLFMTLRTLFGKKYSAFTALPYGPYIVAGTIIMLLFAEEVTSVF